MNVKEAIVARLLELCSNRKMKPNELANSAGVTPSTVYSVIDPKRKNISIITLKKLCDGLDVSLKEFFSSEAFENLEQEMQ